MEKGFHVGNRVAATRARRCRAHRCRALRRHRCLRRIVREAPYGGVAPRALLASRRRIGGPGLRGIHQGVGATPVGPRSRPRLPRLPAHRDPAPPRRSNPQHATPTNNRRRSRIGSARRVLRYGRRHLRTRDRSRCLRLATRALATRSLALGCGGPKTGRGRTAPGYERQQRLRPRLPGARRPASGLPPTPSRRHGNR